MKGITLPCADCKQILLRYANILGDGSFEMICPHCGKLNKVAISQKTHITTTIIVVLLVVITGVSLWVFPSAPKLACSII